MSLGVDDPEHEPGAGDAPDPTARLRALAHPVRMRILSLLTASALTAAEIARELDLTHANASYHLRHLLAAGLIEVAGEERIRGGAAKRYRYDPARQPDQPASTPADSRATSDHRLLYDALAAELRRRAHHLRRGPGNFLTDAEFWIDPETWDEIRNTIAEASARLHHAARPPHTPGTARVSATVALFRMQD
ncbi:helix-turn-helix domain-containing protein [Plantactinospora sp. KLBMP9567]|uniref:ArsR/SmtB family transcription factor n=1 Tax=Plantactinospora sp. KLBMP9567 TaxID=3085900 RepID=UPI002981C3E2|nr:helix-turn-helix domain-containing protein [Plantactinospora sp. KLBMP9567]MDW5327814.1 helix-turn-helix domain-containing protein [Plantactinospora sp. KLBMP9567]